MDTLLNGWFTELSPDDREILNKTAITDENKQALQSEFSGMGGAWPGQAFSLAIDQILFDGKSDYQHVLVFKSKTYGNVLVLDGIIQCTERDEFAYQEMLTHLPMFAHPNPQNVLIIGGGDGGILREVLKHDTVKSVTMCEIDQLVIDVSKKYLPRMSSGFNSPKLTLHVGDGFEFLKTHKNAFDIIITDSSDPIGPAESLFGEQYYRLVREALTSDGILASQAESIWLHLDLIKHMLHVCSQLFNGGTALASANVSTYPSGAISYLLASASTTTNLKVPIRRLNADQIAAMQLRYYNSQVHEAAFVLPQFVVQALAQ